MLKKNCAKRKTETNVRIPYEFRSFTLEFEIKFPKKRRSEGGK